MMCGFAGFFQPDAPLGHGEAKAVASAMAAAIEHRGPDDEGVFSDADGAFAAGFRRLAIIDVSAAGHQPMTSASGRFVIAFNGEVYNAGELRAALNGRGIAFRGHSDTEAMLEHFDAFGTRATLEKLVGMFAIALWDRKERRLMLARDRLGIKPFYWSLKGREFLFGSQLKCFFARDEFEPEIDHDALKAYLRYGYVPAPFTILDSCFKLEPGCWLEIDETLEPRQHRFWDLNTIAAQGLRQPLEIGEPEAVERLHDLLSDAVGIRMVADVPLGALLSGGIDSSTVVSLMQRQSTRPVSTFSIGFSEADFDEAPHARAVAAHLGTEHHELYVSPDDALDVIPGLPQFFDEPFADSSAIPTLLLSRLTRQHVTVALSGDGGDELFAGYRRYWEIADLFGRRDRVPRRARLLASSMLRAATPAFDRMERIWPFLHASLRPAYRSGKLADLLDHDPAWMMRHVVGHWQSPDEVALQGREPVDPVWRQAFDASRDDMVPQLQLADMMTYLPEDILAKVDRASMSAGLEARVPLLDHRVVEFCWQLPTPLRSARHPSKRLLRSVLERYVPASLIDRPKKGFSVPIHGWLRGPLRDWAEDLLDCKRLESAGLVEPTMVARCWSQHQSGQADWRFPLWNVLMLEAWRRQWLEKPAVRPGSGHSGGLGADHPAMTA